ncbi:unnamed protein product [Effrenium voratum]|nr:unnamed protein product [Effrenium voratum]
MNGIIQAPAELWPGQMRNAILDPGTARLFHWELCVSSSGQSDLEAACVRDGSATCSSSRPKHRGAVSKRADQKESLRRSWGWVSQRSHGRLGHVCDRKAHRVRGRQSFVEQISSSAGQWLGRLVMRVSMAQSGLAVEKAPMMGPSSELLELLDTMSKVRMARHILALVGKKDFKDEVEEVQQVMAARRSREALASTATPSPRVGPLPCLLGQQSVGLDHKSGPECPIAECADSRKRRKRGNRRQRGGRRRQA